MVELPGPVGERNLYALHPRGRMLLLPEMRDGLLAQLAAALACGHDAVVGAASGLHLALPASVEARICWIADWGGAGPYGGALIEGDAARVRRLQQAVAALPGPTVPTQAGGAGYRLDWLVQEVSTSINTAAAGGNATLMAMA